MKVFIVGIAGGTGRRIAAALINAGDTVSGLCRCQQQATALQKLGARAAVGDLATLSEHELASAAKGTDLLVFTAGAGENDDDAMIDAIDGRGVTKSIGAARLAGIKGLLLVSVFPEAWRGGDAPKSFEHYIAVKKRADVEVVHSRLDWLIVRPSSLTDDPATGSVSLSAAEIHTTISREDVAATIAKLIHSNVRRRVLEITQGSTPVASAVNDLLSDFATSQR